MKWKKMNRDNDGGKIEEYFNSDNDVRGHEKIIRECLNTNSQTLYQQK